MGWKKSIDQMGFTLIELVMVIVILGVMAAVAIPKYYHIKKDAEIAAAKGVFGGIQGSIASFYAKNKKFPVDAQEAYDAAHIQPGDLTITPNAGANTITVIGMECGNMTASYDPSTGILSYDASTWCP